MREFPRPDQGLDTPSISLITANSNLIPLQPTIAEKTIDGDTVNATIIMGEYEIDIQLDLWASYKTERAKFFDKIVNVFNRSFADNGTQSLMLTMTEYYNQIAQYELRGHRIGGDEESSLKGEWRVSIDISVNFSRLANFNYPRTKSIDIIDQIGSKELL